MLGLGLGAVAILVGWFVVAPLHGAPVGDGFSRNGIIISLALNLPWGVSVGLLGAGLMGRAFPRGSARKLA